MRSEEAERLSKSRKSIVLDPANPSVKNQAKSMAAAAVEGNMRRMNWKQKKEFFKNNKAAVIAPTKSVSKVKLSNSMPKGNFSTSPALSPEQPGPSIPSFPAGSDANNEVIIPLDPFDLNKDENSKVEKSTPNRMYQGINRRASAVSASIDDNTTELRSLLISVLSENPKGMNLKALEKAVTDAFPNASKKIESIVKTIANFQASGRYLLKPGLDAERSKRRASGSGISIDDNIEEGAPSLKMDDPDMFETIDIGGSPVSAAQDQKVNNDSDGKAGTSSESGSDSDSDSESSGSDSGSQSRSAASGSGSSSDSDSDASSSSKEESDEFVDITNDDDKGEAHRKVADELKLTSPPRDFTALDGDDEQIDIGTNLEYQSTSPQIDLNNFNNNNDETAYTAVLTDSFNASHLDKPPEIPGSKNTVNTSIDPSRIDSKYAANEMSYDDLFGDSLAPSSENLPKEETSQSTKQHGSRRKSVSKDGSNHGQTRIIEKGAKPKLKRCSGNENSSTIPEGAKRAKADIYSGATSSVSEHRQTLPPDKHVNERLSKETGNVSWDAHSDLRAQDSSPAVKGRPLASGNIQKINQSPNVLNQTMPSERTQEKVEKSISKKKADKMQKPWNSLDANHGRVLHAEDQYVNFDDSDDSATRKRARHGVPQVEDKLLKHLKDANIDANSMISAKSAKGNVGFDDIKPFPVSNENNDEPSNLHRNNAERSPLGKKVLQRELSDLELGEFREASLENETGRTRKQFERNSSSKSIDGKLANVDNSFPSTANRKAALSTSHDQRKPSPQEFGFGGNINQEGFPKKTPGYDFDNNRSQQRGNALQSQQLPKADNPVPEIALHPDQLGEKPGKREARIVQGGMLDHVDSKKKKTTPKLPQNGSRNAIGSRTQKSISPAENEERSRNNFLIENETSRKRRESSSDEDNLFFSKYDKDEPELKGPIKDFSQYKDYVQEYNEKYEVYSYLNSQIEKTQSEFLKIQEDLNVAKERNKDLYYNILERIRDMYHESGTRHKLMKKVFLLLHEELQVSRPTPDTPPGNARGGVTTILQGQTELQKPSTCTYLQNQNLNRKVLKKRRKAPRSVPKTTRGDRGAQPAAKREGAARAGTPLAPEMDAVEKVRWRFSDGSVTDLLEARSLRGTTDINKRVQFHSSLVQRLALEKEMEGHIGCVNAIAWNSNGSLLISGSDDTRIGIWSYANRELLHDIDTGHSQNIFCTKFVPETSDEVVVSGAGDTEVRVFNLSRLGGRRPREISMEPAAVYRCHSRRIKKLAVEIGNPNVVWSAGEDGTLRQHDFRECSSCPHARSANQECRHVLLDLRLGAKKYLADIPRQTLALKSCDISSVHPHQLLVGGSDAFARLYDRRMLPPLRSCQTKKEPPPCIKMFCPIHLADNRKSNLHLTHVAFSPNGKEVLLSYSGEHVYLFDVDIENMSSLRYSADDVQEQLCLPPFHKEPAKLISKHRFPVNRASRSLYKVDMFKKLILVATKSLEMGANLMHGVEACSTVLQAVEPDIDDNMRHDCLCTRAGLYLKRRWKNDVCMAIRDCNNARCIDSRSFQAHLYMADALLQLGRLKEASRYVEALNSTGLPYSESVKEVENIKERLFAAELEKNKKDQVGNTNMDARHGRLRSLSDLLFRSDASGSSSQEGREDSDYDDEMELDFETSVSGDESRDSDLGLVRGSLSLRFHRRDCQTDEHSGENGSVVSTFNDDSAYQPEVAIDMKQRYVAHCNVGTDIKQASFLGGQGEFIASGSDDGRWFIWEKRTGRLIKMLAGDGTGMNLSTYDCAVATSGIDNTIKLWTPDANATSMVTGPEIDVSSVIENNQRKLSLNREILLVDLLLLELLRYTDLLLLELLRRAGAEAVA
ncbi:hypothetical protein ABZP36_019265 [Zizania latifolia]